MAMVGIVMLPFYLRALGVEAYGLVGLFIVLQTWLALLDFGLSSTLSREAARFRAGALDAARLRHLLRFVELTFLTLAILAAIGLVVGARGIATGWLRNMTLPDAEAVSAIRLIGPVLALRFLVIPDRAFLTGMEDLQWLGAANIVITTLRSVLVLAALHSFIRPDARRLFPVAIGHRRG